MSKRMEKIEKALVGRKIVAVRMLTKEEIEEMGWYESAIVIILDNAATMFPMQDPEGNGPGVIATTIKGLDLL